MLLAVLNLIISLVKSANVTIKLQGVIVSQDQNIKNINKAFESFLEEIDEVKENVESESEFTKGYLKCISDILSGLDSEEKTGMVKMIDKKLEMKYRSEVISEIKEGLVVLLDAYNKL